MSVKSKSIKPESKTETKVSESLHDTDHKVTSSSLHEIKTVKNTNGLHETARDEDGLTEAGLPIEGSIPNHTPGGNPIGERAMPNVSSGGNPASTDAFSSQSDEEVGYKTKTHSKK
jgi:hypothetical protein